MLHLYGTRGETKIWGETNFSPKHEMLPRPRESDNTPCKSPYSSQSQKLTFLQTDRDPKEHPFQNKLGGQETQKKRLDNR